MHSIVEREPGMEYILDFKGKGWRTIHNLKCQAESWEDAFLRTKFATRHEQVIKNMNVLYECLDVRDDFAALRHAELNGASIEETGAESTDIQELDQELEFTIIEQSGVHQCDPDGPIGKQTARRLASMQMMQILIEELLPSGKHGWIPQERESSKQE
ncbi:hypothetical protein CERSUDRAFT_78760 [Gelatoporia subvermispora B]|uniref:Uncharacterized protein n=1 Tax=Ceriporiopsis subvermispora (strain B) TaxID=914234 RepID=M2QVJ9_CERS8|nr:hypothetical protein CERSUDRAFT_78760 [Gelatoporia subvermispora B]